MFLSFSAYRRFLVLALTVLMAIPCFARREIKQLLLMGASQQAKPVQQPVACYTFCREQKQEQKKKVERHRLPSPEAYGKTTYIAPAKDILFPGFHYRLKEKIPSHLLFEQFLN